MVSYVIVELDITAPYIEIYAPRYTTKDVVNEIIIQSNEKLANYQEVYVIDSIGTRHDYTFRQEQDSQFVGLIRFNDFPLGIATIYARMKDDVDNFSAVVQTAILVKESTPSLSLAISDGQRSITANSVTRMQNVSDTIRCISAADREKRQITISDRKRTVTIRE